MACRRSQHAHSLPKAKPASLVPRQEPVRRAGISRSHWKACGKGERPAAQDSCLLSGGAGTSPSGLPAPCCCLPGKIPLFPPHPPAFTMLLLLFSRSPLESVTETLCACGDLKAVHGLFSHSHRHPTPEAARAAGPASACLQQQMWAQLEPGPRAAARTQQVAPGAPALCRWRSVPGSQALVTQERPPGSPVTDCPEQAGAGSWASRGRSR